MKRTLSSLLAAIVVAAGWLALGLPRAQAARASDFPHALTWFNVARPLTLAQLRGRAVLLDFFTPGCINCIHMLPDEKKLEEHFGPRLAVIGIDSPKFSASKTRDGLEAFIERYDLRHPIVLDPDMQMWNAYGVQAWPTLVLLGPDGSVQKTFIGEQSYAQLAGPIEAALANAPPASKLPRLPLRPIATQTRALAIPGGVAVSPSLVAIADTGHNRIVLADHAGRLVAVIGTGCQGRADGGYAQAQFDGPHGLTFHDGALYVADTDNQLIRRVDLAHKTLTTVAGSGERGFAVAGSFPAHSAVLNSPWDVAWSGNALYVSMAGDHQIWRYDPAARTIGPWAGTGEEGLRDGARRDAQFAQPSGMSAHNHTLYETDPESSSVRAIALPGGNVTTLVGHGLFDFGMRNGNAGRAQLQHAEGVAWNAGSLYIADTFNNALRKLDLASHQVGTVAALLNRPLAVAALAPDTLLVAEGDANRIDAVHLPDGKVTPWPIAGLSPLHTNTCRK
ncbi:MAG TPA: thioredoxin-like domain-containing protein [Rhodanobacteraceae bacterium]|jgi:thiol-disulfide isomerase/thioredoxin/sugar lactone lactonase YvrE|nr:thioredoxin-like domain-containing protein [Rhodanobacteraceae bacterium]